MNLPSRIREYRHLFNGHRRIVATIRVDLSRVEFRSGILNCTHCEWEGSKERQPSVELYPEYREWMNTVLADVTAQTGKGLLFLFEPPGANIAEVWLYDPGEPPQLVETLHKPCDKPLSEALGMPAGWKETP
jgi:hypothetical protein